MAIIDETLMTTEPAVRAHLNSMPGNNGACWRCHKPGELAATEVCDACFRELCADCFDANGNWIG